MEPTVTINTKEALADVFGMYNSPEKMMRLAGVPGSKHVPLKKVEAVRPWLLWGRPMRRRMRMPFRLLKHLCLVHPYTFCW